jgi:hypothetical protein
MFYSNNFLNIKKKYPDRFTYELYVSRDEEQEEIKK